jgi:hypothetical protein
MCIVDWPSLDIETCFIVAGQTSLSTDHDFKWTEKLLQDLTQAALWSRSGVSKLLDVRLICDIA